MIRFSSKWPSLTVIVKPVRVRVSDTGEREMVSGREVQFANGTLDVDDDDKELLTRLRNMPEYGSTVIEQGAPPKVARPRKEA